MYDGTRVSLARKASGRGVRELAGELGISHPHLSRIERGLRRPSAVLVVAIAEALDVDPADFVSPVDRRIIVSQLLHEEANRQKAARTC
jgi:transcriptional regulator with XRE-family HTH domain